MKDQAVDEDATDSDIDDERTGGEWVTAENLYKHVSKGDTETVVHGITNESTEAEKQSVIDIKEDAPKHVVFLTSDYAM